MRYVYAFLLLMLANVSLSQDLPFVDGKVIYDVELSFPGLSKQQIFEKSKLFVDEVLAKHHFIIKNTNNESGEIFTSGVTALSEKDRKGFVWDIGEANRLKFNYNIKVSDNSSKVIIDNISIIKLDVSKEIYKPFEDDVMEEKRAIQSFKEGKFKKGREKRYSTIANNVNNTFYSMIAIYKRYIEK
jgi:hypothetical protein